VKPESLWQSYVWSPGICWRCGEVAWVASCGETHSAVNDTTAVIEACAPCLIAIDQIHDARIRWERRGIRPRTPAELACYFVPAARSPEYAQRLREWVESLLVQLDADTLAALQFGVRGHVAIREAS
jgi:hypothetical protein